MLKIQESDWARIDYLNAKSETPENKSKDISVFLFLCKIFLFINICIAIWAFFHYKG